MPRQYYVYILTNKRHTVLYTGVTRDLARRVYEHRHPIGRCFSARYNVTKLVHFEIFSSPREAIQREKQIKSGPRWRKIRLIEELNPEWNDLLQSAEGAIL